MTNKNEELIKQWIKHNLISLATFHKERCDEIDCNIQLSSLHEVFERLNIELTTEEIELLM